MLSGNQALARMRSEVMDRMACGGARHADLGPMYDPKENPETALQQHQKSLWRDENIPGNL